MKEHVIKEVKPGSIAEELEIEAGDVLLTINEEEIEDIFDYRFLIQDEYLEVLIRKQDGEEWELEIDKDYEDPITYPLFSKARARSRSSQSATRAAGQAA